MFKPENKIIIVDDIQEHLDTLSKPFYENGIGCKTFMYDIDYQFPLKNVRVAFFDIRINPTGGGSVAQRYNDLANAIKQYIHVENGPFALIFWTSNKVEIEGIKDYIQERHTDCPKPFLVDFIDKDEFLANPDNLTSKLGSVLNDDTLKCLFEFETLSSQSASMTINQLYEIIPTNDTWGASENFKENFEKVFSKIATSTLGLEHAKKNPGKAVFEAVLPIMNYHFSKLGNESLWNKILKTLKNARLSNEIPNIDGFKESILNTIFHIDNQDLAFPLDVRGAVIEIEKTEPVFKENFGIEFTSWFTHFMPIELSKRRRDVRNKSKVIAIEISSSCDYSQNRKRLNKYLLGIISPVISKEEFGNNSIPLCQYKLDCNFYIEDEFQIWMNLNYVFSALPNDRKFGTPLFILKKEIMDQIGNKYANHVSRIGITSF